MSTATDAAAPPVEVLGLMPGELARVKSAAEIFATLDEHGAFEGLPFMPEMLKYCGRTLPVKHRADKTCAGDGVVRRMLNTVHLENIRCDGSAHDGCQAACLMFWKEAWLERPATRNGSGPHARPLHEDEQQYVADVLQPATLAQAEPKKIYRCQATDITDASKELRFRYATQYVRDLHNWKARHILRGLVIETFNLWQSFSKRHMPRWLRFKGGTRYPFVIGRLEKGKAPRAKLDLQPGELVRIRSKEEIVATLDTTSHNRGLSFDGEMANYCGRVARVRARVNHIIEESNGEMIDIKSDCIVLEGVVCAGDYHRFCPRAIFPYWREVWLERVEGSSAPNGVTPCAGC